MADIILKLEDKQDAREGDVEIVVTHGMHKGARFSVRPKNHDTCHGTGRVIRGGKPGICGCIDGPVRRIIGGDDKGNRYDAMWMTPEARAKARRERLAGEITRAKGELAELMAKRDAAVEQCRQGAAEARGKLDALIEEDRALNEALPLYRDDASATAQELADARKALAAAEQAAKHAALTLEGAARRMVDLAAARLASQTLAVTLDHEAERILTRSDYATRVKGALSEIERLEREQKAVASVAPVVQDGQQSAAA